MKAPCEICPIRHAAERHPDTWWARLWRWHTGWCPGWKKYQRDLAARSRQENGSGEA
ncbi:MAG TPA: hypothetical protein PLQ35_06325 [bacterium]|nr:hypothetical protein [bacterium]HQL61892.1 hypothetical protein [bacterium]